MILDHINADIEQKELIDALKDLNNLVGMKELKQQIINQILFFLQDLNDKSMFMHTVITGPPGCGKTSVAHIISKIYKSLGFLTSDKVVKADRSDLIGEYVGWTAPKTKKVLESAKGGVLFIDEAYSLGSGNDSGNGDTFSKECIDTINEYLSLHVDDLICIIAGYKEEVDRCFFKQNQGLERRFPWRFNIEKYNDEELCEIMFRQASGINNKNPWKIIANRGNITKKIKENLEYLSGNGGDTLNLLDKCKIAHARRIFVELAKKQNENKKSEKHKQKKNKKGLGEKPENITIDLNTQSEFNTKDANALKDAGLDISRKITDQDFEQGLKTFLKSKIKKEEDIVSHKMMYT